MLLKADKRLEQPPSGCRCYHVLCPNKTAPAFNIKGQIIVNFDRQKVARALGLLPWKII